MCAYFLMETFQSFAQIFRGIYDTQKSLEIIDFVKNALFWSVLEKNREIQRKLAFKVWIDRLSDLSFLRQMGPIRLPAWELVQLLCSSLHLQRAHGELLGLDCFQQKQNTFSISACLLACYFLNFLWPFQTCSRSVSCKFTLAVYLSEDQIMSLCSR